MYFAEEEQYLKFTSIVESLPQHPEDNYNTRPIEEITTLTIHHTVSPPDRPISSIAYYHVNNRDWPGIAYHYVITDQGEIFQTNYLTTKSYHAGSLNAPGDENLWSVGIALQGDFSHEPPPEAQLEATRNLIAYLKGQLGDLDVLPHRLMPGAETACPGNTFMDWLPGLV
jgi:N-acetyl-anhydromuramyl-L-alanine amidase AmpD